MVYIPEKPIKFGYNFRTISFSNGFVNFFDTYARKSNNNQASKSTLGLDGKVVVDLLNNVDGDNQAVYFVNFFHLILICLLIRQKWIFCMQDHARKAYGKATTAG